VVRCREDIDIAGPLPPIVTKKHYSTSLLSCSHAVPLKTVFPTVPFCPQDSVFKGDVIDIGESALRHVAALARYPV